MTGQKLLCKSKIIMKRLFIAIMMIAPLSLNAQKFAHFNSADIIPNMKEYVTATEEIQTMAKQYEDDMKLMQEELQKKTRMYYLLGKWSVRIGIPLIIILVAYIPRKIKEKRSDRQWYKEHGYNDDDDYNGSY